MTDPVQSGGEAPAAEPNTAVPLSGTAQPFGTFSTTRGSGLARGKRSSTPAAASAAPATTGEYKPTALEVITPEREYKNPFGGPSAEPAAAPPPASPIEIAEEKKTETVAEVEVPRVPSADLFPLAAEKDDAGPEVPTKAELNILPPAETKRPALNWENPANPGSKANAPVYPPRQSREERRDERPTFRPEPRRDQPQPRPEGRELRPEDRDPRPAERDSRREGSGFRPEGRDHRRESEPSHGSRAAAPQKPRGFFAWLKGLFGVKPAAQPAPEIRREEHGFERDGQHRRRRRGGRGRSFNDRGGDRQGQPNRPEGGEARFQGGEQRHGDEHGEHRPRRHRGGRGRSRGDHGGGPRSEGRQGGGAI